MSDQAIFVYVTTPSLEIAEALSHAVVEARLAACANIIPGMASIYHWQGKVEKANETAIIFKTRSTLFSALENKVVELHPYDTPCIVALPVMTGHAPYLDWIATET